MSQLESLALDTIDRTLNAQTVEDTTIELKSTWPSDERKSARQIAGLANAARGKEVVWIVGLAESENDEPGKLIGCDSQELAEWWPRVQKYFVGLSPDLSNCISLRHESDESNQLVALQFETDRPPYVVASDGNGFGREVPWRSGNVTRTAKRSELLQVLGTRAELPTIQITAGSVRIETGTHGGELACDLLCFCPTASSSAFIAEDVELKVSLYNGEIFSQIELLENRKKTKALLIRDLSMFRLTHGLPVRENAVLPATVDVEFKIRLVPTGDVIAISETLNRSEGEPVWTFGNRERRPRHRNQADIDAQFP